MTDASRLRILYLVHDLSDPAVQKRTAMLIDGGASVTLAGFRRTTDPISQVAGCSAIDLGRTHNGGFAQRLWSVVREAIWLNRHRAVFTAADLILARNLEMLALGVRGRGLCAVKPPLVYECLDIHRLLLKQGIAGRILRRVEGLLAKHATALITSSPAFVSDYFDKLSRVRLSVRLVENKLYIPKSFPLPGERDARVPGPPWRIGWFGAIRCRESLALLNDLARQGEGRIEVIIRGRPALDQFEDFGKSTSETPWLRFLGPYANPAELATIYNDVHFTWAIDKFEAGLNSSWLLPNRLYEGGAFASVPLAEKSVEAGRFLDRLGIGVTLENPLSHSLKIFFQTLSAEHYRALEAAATKVPRQSWISTSEDCVELVRYLRSLT